MKFSDFADGGSAADSDYIVGYQSAGGASSDRRWRGYGLSQAIAGRYNVKAFNAKGDGATDDTTALQNAINTCSAAGGGFVYAPRGIYKTTSGIIVKDKVCLVGDGRRISYISGFVSNVNTVMFDVGVGRGTGLRDLTVDGYYNANPALVTTNAITVQDTSSVDLINVEGWYGSAGLLTSGIDGDYDNCWFNGCNDSVVSHGANWYRRCIFNANGSFGSYRYAFEQGSPVVGATSLENGFEQCDFSGNFTYAAYINCSHGSVPYCVTKFSECVMGAPINIVSADQTAFVSATEIGSASFTLNGTTGGTCLVDGCLGQTAISLVGTGFIKGTNYNIS